MQEKKNVAYLLFNEKYSGVIESQAIDLVRWIPGNCAEKATLICFIPFRNRQAVLQRFKDLCPDKSTAYLKNPPTPFLPFVRLYNMVRLSRYLVRNNTDVILCRGIVATDLALLVKKWLMPELKVCFDGRGAALAEQREFGNMGMNLNRTFKLEQKAILESDCRLGVSEELVNYWSAQYGYMGNNHVVIPTTLSSSEGWVLPSEAKIDLARREMGFESDETIFVYSGSLAGWQGLSEMIQFIEKRVAQSEREKFLFLSNECAELAKLTDRFPGRIYRRYVAPDLVKSNLMCADYALLFRDNRTTNNVASPTKFAEYLSCGLPVLLMGNPSSIRFIKTHDCGKELSMSDFDITLGRVDYSDRQRIHRLAKTNFSKSHFFNEYKKLLR